MTFNVAVTAIVRNGDKFLITRRHKDKKKWPGKWTVPGGKVESDDFVGTPTDIDNQWYHVLENAVRREVHEETGLHIGNIRYLCNIGIPDTIIVSYVADTVDQWDVIKLQEEECDDYAWVTAKEAEDYDLIDGILGEIKEASLLD